MKGIRIALSTKDTNEANPKDLVLSTELVSLPIKKAVSFDGSIPPGASGPFQTLAEFIIEIPHDLKFTPLFRCWIQLIDTSTSPWGLLKQLKPVPCITGGTNGAGGAGGIRIAVEAKSLPGKLQIIYTGIDVGTGPFPPTTTKVVGFIYVFDTPWEQFNGS